MTQTRWFYLRPDSTDDSILDKPKFQGAVMRPCDLCNSHIVPASIVDKHTALLCEPCGLILASGQLRGKFWRKREGDS